MRLREVNWSQPRNSLVRTFNGNETVDGAVTISEEISVAPVDLKVQKLHTVVNTVDQETYMVW